MIRRLTLQNWRSYENFTAEFGVGTTFVVAPNGVGKTSLVEAARWALFGRNASVDNTAVRAGAPSARVIVELELPDLRVLSVERTLSGKPRSASRHPIVRLNGAPVPEDELERYLISSYGAEPGFLAGLTMPTPDRDQDVPSGLGLEEHLGRYYGVGSLRNAVAQLKTMQKTNQASIRRIKDANSASAQRLAELQKDVEQTDCHVQGATERHRAVADRLDRARERERRLEEMQKWQDERSAWVETVERLAVRISAVLGGPVSPENIESVLNERMADLDQQIETARVGVAVNRAKEEALTANEERLSAAHGDCPVCRRPLDDATVALAHQANTQEISAIRNSILEFRSAETDLLAQRERVKAAQTEWRQIPQPGKPPQPPSAGDDIEPIPAARLFATADAALGALVEARAAHVQAIKELDKARTADEAMRELESLFRQEAALRVAVETTEATLRELLNETIRPLAVEVNQRWKALFPDRGDLHTYSDGRITRTVNGHQLSYDSFSTGETMGATILLRLLVAEMATTTDFCWFDEPLEHLDPDVRRKVASLLSRVTSGEGPLKQLVVTTYEEPLARHLQARDEQRVSLLDVRQAG
jgi:DNA repair exonuclease SbcCD ATPase subunit